METLKTFSSEEPFDFVFIDADKPNNLAYYLEAKRLTKKGAVIVSPCPVSTFWQSDLNAP